VARRLTLDELAANVRAADVDLPVEVEVLLGLNGDRSAPGGDPHVLDPLDWPALIRDGVPPVEYLHHPYFPRGARIWTWGGTGTAKSIYCAWVASKLSRQGIRVSSFSEENPLVEDLRRLALLDPDPAFFRFFYRQGMDLQDPAWADVLIRTTQGDDAVFLDSWTDLWHGDEGDNRAVQSFDANVLNASRPRVSRPSPFTTPATGTCSVTGRAPTAGRGASSLGQKADVTLEFKSEADGAFTIVYSKSRIGGEHQPDRTFRVVDTDEGALDVVEVPSAATRAVDELAEKMAQAILTASRGFLTTTEVRAAAGGSRDRQTEALTRLEVDDRLQVTVEKVTTTDGKLRDSKVWRPSPGGLF
jgi:hypothetical protein